MAHTVTHLLRASVEQAVSAHLGREWAATDVRDMADYACHPCAILSGAGFVVFAKFSDAPDGRAQFAAELAGLRILAERADVLVPTPVATLDVACGTVLVLEAVREVERGPRQWRDIGQTLARIHRVQGHRFGLETSGYFGPLPQDNTPCDEWPTFYAQRRLQPMLRRGVDLGAISTEVAHLVEALIERLPLLCGPPVQPTLLHGDAQQNNYVSSAAGAVVIDPAVYYGHPEMDLAYVDYWQPVPQGLFDAYRDEAPIDPGFAERRDLWRVWPQLASVAVEGARHLPRLVEAVRKYL